jgi:predicted NUDIX family NTP pyrophosphohydrolase
MPKTSAGLLLYRMQAEAPEVLLVHPGGPFWAKKDEGVWSIPKGAVGAGEPPLAAAQREFREETGCDAQGAFLPLTALRQPSGKTIQAWAVQGDCDPTQLHSNAFTLEWPPRSGKQAQFPEIDRAAWFSVPVALRKILPGQRGFVTELARLLQR